MIYVKADEVIKELKESLLPRYQTGLEESMKGSDFIFNCVNLLHYKFHKTSLNRGGSNVDSLNWIKNRKAAINRINDDDKCFQYGATVALNHEEIEKNFQRISKIKIFSNKYNWQGINYPSLKDG